MNPDKGRAPLRNTLLIRMMTAAIRLYQLIVSPALGPCCRFYPTCSQYAVEALRRHGIGRGTVLSVKRILRCHPFHSGGYDPVE